MDSGILCDLLKIKIAPEKFQTTNTDVKWLTTPTAEETALAADVIANYDTLAAAHQAQKMKQQAIDAIQAILDTQAKAYGFDSVHTAAVWVTSRNPARKARADALVAWGDKVWDFAEAEWAKQAQGESTYTDIETFLADLPAFPGVTG